MQKIQLTIIFLMNLARCKYLLVSSADAVPCIAWPLFIQVNIRPANLWLIQHQIAEYLL